MSKEEYKELVLAYYEGLAKTGDLSSELLSPTPGNIKNQILNTLSNGLDSKDEKTLESFVGCKSDVGEYQKAVEIKSADLYRPVVNMLRERSVNTNIKYVNLLALLIGYPSRPFHPNLKPSNLPKSESIEIPLAQQIQKPADVSVEMDVQVTKKNYLKFLWIFAVIIVIGLGSYAVFKKAGKHYTGSEGCMIWNDDHYEPIDCNDQSTTAPHYPINHELVAHFSRITRPDTLTYRSIRKVWYSNYKGRMEFYTDSGANPLDTNFRVLPMTTHIFEKYVLHITN